MRPLSIQIEGLRSFRAPVEIAFGGKEHVAIVGDTGVGKSSLLEAMTWALYGCTSWSKQPNQELMNATATFLRVRLRFAVRGQVWEVVRALKRDGNGAVAASGATLDRYDDGVEPLEHVEGVKRVEGRVAEIIGLDADAFMRTVILPQGQFARLLVGDGSTDRAGILRQVWRLDELGTVRATAARAREELRPVTARIEQALDGQPQDPVAHLAALEAGAVATAERARQSGALATDVKRARETLAGAIASARIAAEIVGAVHVDEAALGDRASTIGSRSRELGEEHRRIDAERTAAQGELARVPADADGLGEADVARADEGIGLVASWAEEVVEDARKVRELVYGIDNADREVTTRQGEAEAARAHLDALLRTRLECQAATRRAIEIRDEARTALAEARRERAEARRLEAVHAAKQNEAAALEVALAQTSSQLDATRRAEQESRAAFEAAARAHAAAHAATGLVPGDPCPVCARELTETWSPPAGGEVEALRRAHRRAADALTAADRETAKATERSQAAARRVAELFDQLTAAQARAHGALLVLAEKAGRPVESLEDDQSIVGSLVEAAAAAENALAAHDQAILEAQGAASESAAHAGAARERAASLREQGAGARKALTRRVTDLRARVAGLPGELGVAVELVEPMEEIASVDLSTLAGARERLAERRQVLADRHAQRRQLDARIAAIAGRSAALEEVRRHDVDEPAGALVRELAVLHERLARAAQRIEIGDPGLPIVASAAPTDLGTLVEALASRARWLRAEAESRGSLALREEEESRRVLANRAAELGLGADAQPDAVVNAACDHDEGARFAARTQAAEVAAFARKAVPLEHLRATLRKLAAKELALTDLLNALQDGAFPKWVTLRRSRALLVHASRLLAEMTAGRYAFADLDDERAEWRVFDRDTGQPRSPASLSGGEQFVASLALSLGMVEMMARSGGRLESLWLDEGFGALDRSNLDAAIDALATVASGGRLVAVISHVRAVAERVDDVLAVYRTPVGSAARWLTPAERALVVEGDAQSDGAGAAQAGLLD